MLIGGGWIFGSILVGALATDRKKLGFLWGFMISLFLSPIIGLIVVLSAEHK